MRIVKCLNTNLKEINSKKFNIFIGISLGNKYFSQESIRKYILWAVNNTKEYVVVLIADKVHAINYEIRSKYSKARSLKISLRKGEDLKKTILCILSHLPNKSKIKVLNWNDIESAEYKKQKNIFFKEFEFNDLFHKEVILCVKDSVKDKKLKEEDYESLAFYVLNELPLFVNGFKHKGILYNLCPYPGIGEIDYLATDIYNGKRFPELSKKLDIKNKMAILEAYVD